MLYELYAGRRLFPVQTYEEREASVTTRIARAPGIDPEIERIIHACLESDPGERPASALAIAALLPGGDPLAAAIAKGVVPSPEMVAAAGPRARCIPRRRGRCWAPSLSAPWRLPPKPRDECGAFRCSQAARSAGRARRNILAERGADDVEADSAFWFDFGDASPSQKRFHAAESTAPGDRRTKVKFVYRQSPTYLVPQNLFTSSPVSTRPRMFPGWRLSRSIRSDD